MLDRTRRLLIGSVLITVVAGVWLGPRAAAAAQGVAPSAQNPPSTRPPQPVAVVLPTRMTVARSLDVPATLEAIEAADLCAKVSGYVTAVHTDIGADVAAGTVLAELAIPELELERVQAEATLAARSAGLAAAETAAIASARAGVAQARSRVDVARSEAARKAVDLALAQRLLDRRTKLFADQAITQEQLEDVDSQLAAARAEELVAKGKIGAAEADVTSAEATLAAAHAGVTTLGAERDLAAAQVSRVAAMLAYTKIVAPFAGVVARRAVDRGDLVQAGTTGQKMPLFVVQRIDRVRVVFSVPEVDQPFVRAGTKVRVRPYAVTGNDAAKVIQAEVTRVASSLDPNTRTMRAEVELDNQARGFLHGMYAQVTLAIDPHENALTIPAKAILTQGREAFVFVARAERAVRVSIKTGIDDGMRVEVVEGLRDDDQVIVAGQGLLGDGDVVRPVAEPAPAGARSK